MRNQPVDELYGKGANPDFRDIGVRWKYVWNKSTQDEEAMTVEPKDDATQFVETDELYPMEGYTGTPEFDIADREKYDLT
jgi:hypothetical protein